MIGITGINRYSNPHIGLFRMKVSLYMGDMPITFWSAKLPTKQTEKRTYDPKLLMLILELRFLIENKY